jgi:hypothetical protein
MWASSVERWKIALESLMDSAEAPACPEVCCSSDRLPCVCTVCVAWRGVRGVGGAHGTAHHSPAQYSPALKQAYARAGPLRAHINLVDLAALSQLPVACEGRV